MYVGFYLYRYGYSGDTIIFGDEEKGKRVQELTPVVL